MITMYLLPEVNLQLRPRLLALRPGTRIVSHDYDLGDWAPDRTIVVEAPDKPVGPEPRSRLHLWAVPAQVDGLWCSTAAPAVALRLRQRYQQVDAELEGAAWCGRDEGRRLTLQGPEGRAAVLQAADRALRVARAAAGHAAGGPAARAGGGERCPLATR